MAKIRYSDEFICPTCGNHTALVCHTDGTHQAHCMICDVYYDVEIANITNADRIRSMTDEELAETLRALTDCVRCFAWDKDECDVWQQRPCYTGEIPCKEMWIRWLGKEASE